MSIKKLKREIISEKNLQEALPLFLEQSADIYFIHSSMESLIYYYEAGSSAKEAGRQPDSGLLQIFQDMDCYVKQYVLDGKNTDRNEAEQEICRIRERLIDKMETIINYADCFSLYEYLIHRQKYVYDKKREELNVEEACLEITQKIFAGGKAAVMEKILAAVYLLPIRMARSKFFDIIKNTFYLYTGQEHWTLEDFKERLMGYAGMVYCRQADSFYEEKLSDFRQIRFVDMQEEAYLAVSAEFAVILARLAQEVDFCHMLMELANTLYVTAVTQTFASEKGKRQAQDLLPSMEQAREQYLQGFPEEGFDKMPAFSDMEGKLEEYAEEITSIRLLFEKITEMQYPYVQEWRETKLFQALEQSSKLKSGSLFVDFRKEKKMEGVSQEQAEKSAQSFIALLSEHMKQNDKSLNRAVMAAILSNLPVFFSEREEIEEYVRTAFENSTDSAEKWAGYELLIESLNEFP